MMSRRRCWSRHTWVSLLVATGIRGWVGIDGLLLPLCKPTSLSFPSTFAGNQREHRTSISLHHRGTCTIVPIHVHGMRSRGRCCSQYMLSEESGVGDQEDDNNLNNEIVFFGDDDKEEDDLVYDAADWPEYDNDLATDSGLVFDLDFNQTLQSLIMQQYKQTGDNSDETNLVFSDVAYFYLRDELGISEEIMGKITFQAGQILGLKPNVLRSKVKFLQDTLDMTTDEVRDIVQLQPTLLGMSVKQNLKPTIEFLCQELGMNPKLQLKTLVMSAPSILGYSLANLAAKLNFFNTTLGLTVQERRAVLLAEPRLLCCGLESSMLRLKFWRREMRIPLDQLRKIVQKNPRVLMYSLNDNLRPKLIFYLIMTLHMEPRQVLKLLLAYPNFLNYSLEDHLLPITRYFISELEYSSLEFRNLLLKCPRIMTSALYKIKHVVGYFRYELGMEASHVKRVIYQAPQVMGLSDVNLRSKVEFVRATFDLNEEELRHVLASVPTLLVCGVEQNLQPKMDYLRDVFDKYHSTKFDAKEDKETEVSESQQPTSHLDDSGSAQLRQAFLKFPTLLVYSLEKRIRPRLELLLEAGISPSKITVGIPMKQANFESWLQRHGERLDRLHRQQDGDEDGSVTVNVRVDDTKSSSQDGRIVQWTRARRRA